MNSQLSLIALSPYTLEIRAQSIYATLTGIVTYPSGGVISGAR